MGKTIQLSDALKAFGEFLQTVDLSKGPREWPPKRGDYLFSRGDLTLLLSGADAVSYKRCLRDLYAAVAPKEILSRGVVENLANNTFAAIAKKATAPPGEDPKFQSFCKDELRKLKKALEQEPSTWKVIEPACGIDQTGLPMKVGRVNFVLATPDLLDDIPEAQFTKAVTKERLAGKVLGQISVQAVDIDAAGATAIRILQQTMDCVNFFAAVVGIRGQAYLLGEKDRGLSVSLSLGPENQVIHQSFLYGPGELLPLQELVKLRGFERISKMLESNSLGTLQDRISRALQWAGRAYVDSRREESFLLMAIALESLLLSGQSDENISQKVALRCVHLIGMPDMASRKSLMRNVKDLYGRRSKIVHSGKVEVSDSEIGLLREYLTVALSTVINKEPFSSMTDEKELENWFEERMLEVQVPTSDDLKPGSSLPKQG